MQAESVKQYPPQRPSIHRNISLKDYCIMAGITIVSFPIGYYLGRGNGKFVQKATMYTTAALGLMGGYSIALVNTRKRILSQ